jgi:outer membrane protein assembly factor BamB
MRMKKISKRVINLLAIIFFSCGLIILLFYLSFIHVPDNELWRVTTLSRTQFVTVSNNMVLLESENINNGDCRCVYAADKETGKIVWSTEKLAEPYIAGYKELNPASSRIPGIFEIIGTDSKNKVVFVTVNSFIYALDESHGNIIWGPIGVSSYVFPESLKSNMLFITNDSGNLIALEKSSGKELWKTKTVDTNPRLIIHENIVYLDIEDGNKDKLLAFDIQNGQMIWSIDIKSWRYLPLFAGNNLYLIWHGDFGSKNGEIVAVNTNNGKEIWNAIFTGDYSYEPSHPQVADNQMYLIQIEISNNERVYKLVVRNALSGEILWEFNQNYSDGNLIYYINNDIVYVGSETGNIFALNAKTGQEIWKTKIGAFPTCITIENDLLVIDAEDNYIATLNPKTGITQWKKRIGVVSNRYFSECFASDSSVRIYSNKLFVVDNSRKLHVLSLDTGQELWSWKDFRYPAWRITPIHKPTPQIGMMENDVLYIFNSRAFSDGIFAFRIQEP